MDHCSQILLLLRRGDGNPPPAHRIHDAAVQQGRCQFNGMTRHGACVQAVEPTRFHIVPRAILNYHVVVDAVLLGFFERPVRDLVHAHRA
jgi:hypothetical protein